MNTLIRASAFALSLACAAITMAPVSVFSQAPVKAPAPAPAPQPEPAQQEMKQIALTDKQVENAIAANDEINPILEKVPDDAQPDPKIMAQLEAIAKKHGFSSYAEYANVTDNISAVMSGFDPATKKYVGEEAVLKGEIAQVQADKTMSPKDKKDSLSQLNDALKYVMPLQFQGNVAVVAKYLDKLSAAMPQDKQ